MRENQSFEWVSSRVSPNDSSAVFVALFVFRNIPLPARWLTNCPLPTGGNMRLKQYFPISAAFFFVVVIAVSYSSVPVAPVAIILLAGETLLRFQLEDHRVPRALASLFKPAAKHGH
jgi:hypothetical protein